MKTIIQAERDLTCFQVNTAGLRKRMMPTNGFKYVFTCFHLFSPFAFHCNRRVGTCYPEARFWKVPIIDKVWKAVSVYIPDRGSNRAFSHDVTAAILVFKTNKTAAMVVYQDNPEGVELFSYVNAFFCFNKLA